LDVIQEWKRAISKKRMRYRPQELITPVAGVWYQII
jgi:hypothetical protein